MSERSLVRRTVTEGRGVLALAAGLLLAFAPRAVAQHEHHTPPAAPADTTRRAPPRPPEHVQAYAPTHIHSTMPFLG